MDTWSRGPAPSGRAVPLYAACLTYLGSRPMSALDHYMPFLVVPKQSAFPVHHIVTDFTLSGAGSRAPQHRDGGASVWDTWTRRGSLRFPGLGTMVCPARARVGH